MIRRGLVFPDHPLIDVRRRSFFKDGEWKRASPRLWDIFILLAMRCGDCVGKEQIQDWLYDDDPDGGAYFLTVITQICRLRKVCSFQIDTLHGYGYILSGYKIERSAEARAERGRTHSQRADLAGYW